MKEKKNLILVVPVLFIKFLQFFKWLNVRITTVFTINVLPHLILLARLQGEILFVLHQVLYT